MTGDGKISTQDLTLNPNLLTVVVGKVQNNLFKAVVGKVQGGEGREGEWRKKIALSVPAGVAA